jgi:GNAT superfamily N-acetyltransferase
MVRKAAVEDAVAMAPLMTQLGYPTTPVQMKDRLPALLADEGYATLVAEHEGAVVGLIGVRMGRYYEREGLYAQILVLAVDEEAQGQGIGRKLVEAGEKWALERGAQAVLVNSGRQRTESHAFYESVGYASTGLRFVKALTEPAK